MPQYNNVVYLFSKPYERTIYLCDKDSTIDRTAFGHSQPQNLALFAFTDTTSYSRIMQRLTKTAPPHEQTLKLLTWMVCAKRPMKWREIQCAVSIDIEEQVVDWDRKQFSVDSKDLCGSLVEVHADGTVNIVHHTAKR